MDFVSGTRWNEFNNPMIMYRMSSSFLITTAKSSYERLFPLGPSNIHKTRNRNRNLDATCVYSLPVSKGCPKRHVENSKNIHAETAAYPLGNIGCEHYRVMLALLLVGTLDT